jgi:hypothetical protein
MAADERNESGDCLAAFAHRGETPARSRRLQFDTDLQENGCCALRRLSIAKRAFQLLAFKYNQA